MYKTERTSLPNSNPAKGYPDTTYMAANGAQSGAETISYYLRPDSTTSIPYRYLLFRRVNALPATLIARGLVKDSRDTVPFFTYYKTDTLNRLRAIPRGLFPIYHGMIHGAADDTGKFALTDSIRAVRVHFLTASRDPRTGQDALRTVETLVRLMNAGLIKRQSCGQPPLATPAPVVTAALVPTPRVTVTWTKSGDDAAGEKDIARYAIFRRLNSAAVFGDPITSIPQRDSAQYAVPNYSYVDLSVVRGNSYVYGIAAQDCTPLLSAVSSSLVVTVP
jgi:hypothetical protein